jgi:hypothetical protein
LHLLFPFGGATSYIDCIHRPEGNHMRSGRNIALLTFICTLLVLALPGLSAWDALCVAVTLMIVGIGVLYPLIVSGQANLPQHMQDVEVGPATSAILF